MLFFLSILYMTYFGLYMYYNSKKHLLMMLLSLEFVSLVILMMMINLLMIFIYDCILIIYFIIIMVCEAVMGLVLLTLIIRTHGMDYMKSSILIMC
uniref:NADH-ubiquinone oxidoreductase chain 4L n=1 Tax=Euphyllura phillyreae TaxID=2008460 RepID=A0A344A2B4_9HEMI|nr:NADH dehydrogenase subunit 4L [Euphyllura phillyreae]AWU48905.1 NADH dehydrogenase subunit 4L [Euphyllura phillyreae]